MARLPLMAVWGPIVTAAVAGCGGGGLAGTAAAPTPARAAESAAVPDPGWTLQDLDGRSFTLGDLRGRPVFVNLWATWCPPCVQELGSIDRLAGKVGELGIHFLLVSPEDPEVVRSFVRRVELELPVVLEGTMAPREFGDLVLPTTAILDRQGRMVLLHRGAAAWDGPEVVRLLRQLAAEQGPP